MTTLYAQCLSLTEGDATLAGRICDLVARRGAREIGCGLTDKSLTIQGGDLDCDEDGFALMRPADEGASTGNGDNPGPFDWMRE